MGHPFRGGPSAVRLPFKRHRPARGRGCWGRTCFGEDYGATRQRLQVVALKAGVREALQHSAVASRHVVHPDGERAEGLCARGAGKALHGSPVEAFRRIRKHELDPLRASGAWHFREHRMRVSGCCLGATAVGLAQRRGGSLFHIEKVLKMAVCPMPWASAIIKHHRRSQRRFTPLSASPHRTTPILRSNAWTPSKEGLCVGYGGRLLLAVGAVATACSSS